MKSTLKQIAKRLAPFPLQFYLNRSERARIDGKMRKHRQDMVNFPLGDSAYLQAYWKIYGVGRGPALALYIDSEEVLKFDFYGDEKAHYHVQSLHPAPCRHSALRMREKTIPEQIDRALFDLEHNLYWYLERHPLQSVRQFRVKKATLKATLDQVKPLLLSYVEKVPSADAVEPSRVT
jgi:hypothetical protein